MGNMCQPETRGCPFKDPWRNTSFPLRFNVIGVDKDTKSTTASCPMPPSLELTEEQKEIIQKHFRNTVVDKRSDIFHKTMLNCMQSSPKLNEIIACQMFCYRDLTKWPKLNKLCEAQLNFYDRLIYVLKLDPVALDEAVYSLGIIHHGYAKYGLKPVFLDMWQQNLEQIASRVKFNDDAEKEAFMKAFNIFNTYVIETMNVAYLKCQMDYARVPGS